MKTGLDAGALTAEQGVTSAEYSVEQAQQQLKAAKAAVYDAERRNYRVTRDQLEGNITDAEEALRDAEEALGDAQAAYNDAVAGQESAKKEAAALFEQKTADYKKAAEEWAHLEGTYLADIETEKVNVKDAKDALDNKYPTPPKEGEDGYADSIASDEFKAYQESEGKLRTARETYVSAKIELPKHPTGL